MADTIEQVRELLLSSPEYDEEVASEVTSFLALVATRLQHVESLSGPPRLATKEALAQTYAGAFHREMFNEVAMLNGAAVGQLVGHVADVRGFLRRLRSSSNVIAVKHGNAFVYPAFQFDPHRHKVRAVVARVNERLGAASDPWGALAWWTAPNPRWDHRRPLDHVDDERLIELVEAESGDEY